MCSPSVNTKHHFQKENNQQFPAPEKVFLPKKNSQLLCKAVKSIMSCYYLAYLEAKFVQWHCSETFLTESSKLGVEKWAAKCSRNKPLSWPDTKPLSHDQLFISLQQKARQEIDVRFVKKFTPPDFWVKNFTH